MSIFILSNAILLGPAEPAAAPLPLFDAKVPAGFPSPALDHMEQMISLDELLDIQVFNQSSPINAVMHR